MLLPSLCLLAAATAADAKKLDATQLTCEEFAAQSPEGRTRTTAFLAGYSKRGTPVDALAEVEVQRELDSLVEVCLQTPKQSVLDKLVWFLPGGKKKLKPTALTCEEFVSLGSDVQPEVVYWLDGYHRKTGREDVATGEVDLERDLAVLVEICKPTPKASLWERIREKM
jgi:hypothetical protein